MGGGGGNMGGPQTPAGDQKKEGVAEAAPKAVGLLPTTPALPPAKGRRKRWKLLELDGYFRARTLWFKNFNLGFPDRPDLGGSPFPTPLGCKDTLHSDPPCGNSFGSTDMRLRLEPTINLDEGTSVHVQADALDNTLLGSTPTGEIIGGGTYTSSNLPPLGAFGYTQDAPQAGKNGTQNSISVKRAWAEVAIPIGVIKVGRMPNQWGMGIMYNGGGLDPINGTYDYDADYGDSIDRASFSLQIPGTPLRAMVAMDWPLTRLTSSQTLATDKGYEGRPFDLDQSDDLKEYVGVISKMDSPQEFKDTMERGGVAANYGVYFTYQTQGWDDDLVSFDGTTFNADGDHYVPRGLKMYNPDVWAKVGWNHFTFEGELAAQLGKIDHLDEYGIDTEVQVRKVGGAGRLQWKGLDNKLTLGFESGFATGDQYDNTPQGTTNLAYSNPYGNKDDSDLTQFIFNRAYNVDMILWRRLYGAVTNAVYFKPYIQYDLTKNISFKGSNITSMAIKSVATPGNARWYGTEFDVDLGFHTDRIYAGISYGVFFPFGAMNHPDTDANGDSLNYGTDTTTGVTEIGDASTAHTIQTRLVLAF
ncbi:MAG TPA: TIGR04551 family protein [Kofleriaceae bacterium]|jgi:uncharacterized protein (TIGR04551 family)